VAIALACLVAAKLANIGVPLHKGAARFYKEVGAL